MKKETLLAIAAAITAIANDLDAETAAPAETTGGGEAPAAKRRGRPPTTPAPVETPAAETKETPVTNGKTYEDLKVLIDPLVKGGQGPDVKTIIAKYAVGGGGLKELATLPQHHAAFEKEIEALSY
jgi:hypothetical protein